MTKHPGTPRGGYWYANAIWESDLPAPARLTALVLNGKADNATGRLTERLSLSEIARRTGLSRRTVATHLNTLEEGGWVRRERPERWKAREAKERTAYTVTIPPGYPQASARAALASAGAALGLVQELHPASAGAAHSSSKRTKRARANGAAAPSLALAGTNPAAPVSAAAATVGGEAAHTHAFEPEGAGGDCAHCPLPETNPVHEGRRAP